MVARDTVAGNDTEDPLRISQRLPITRVEECGVAGVKTRRDCPNSRLGGDATPHDEEISRFVAAV